LAQSKAENSAVKQFAQQMITDHTRLQEQWTAMASRNGMTFQPVIGSQHRQKLDRLERVSGGEFDRVYMTMMIRDHNDQVDYFENQGRSAQSAEVRQLVTAGLPTLQQHLSLAKQIGVQVGADTTSGRYAERRSGDDMADADREFVRDIAAAHVMEIRLGQLAQKKGRTRAVKEFGERLVTDYTRLQKRWTSMASRAGFKPGMGMGDNRREKVDRVEKLSGKAFDRAFIETVIETHQANVNYLQKEGRAADAGTVRRHAADDLPIWQQHLRTARQIGKQVGADNINRQASVTR
jgi:putative membrane protein